MLSYPLRLISRSRDYSGIVIVKALNPNTAKTMLSTMPTTEIHTKTTIVMPETWKYSALFLKRIVAAAISFDVVFLSKLRNS